MARVTPRARLKDNEIKTVRLGDKTVAGAGTPVGQVYRLADGRLVYVKGKTTP